MVQRPLFTRQPMQESYEGPPFPGERPHTMKIIQFNKVIQIYKKIASLTAEHQPGGKYRFIFVQTKLDIR